MPLPLSHFHDTMLKSQRALCDGIQTPHHNTLAILLLSRPVRSITSGDDEALIMEFFGVYWIFGSEFTGFFTSEEEAVRYLQPL